MCLWHISFVLNEAELIRSYYYYRFNYSAEYHQIYSTGSKKNISEEFDFYSMLKVQYDYY